MKRGKAIATSDGGGVVVIISSLTLFLQLMHSRGASKNLGFPFAFRSIPNKGSHSGLGSAVTSLA